VAASAKDEFFRSLLDHDWEELSLSPVRQPSFAHGAADDPRGRAPREWAQERSFGLVVGSVCAGLAAHALWKRHLFRAEAFGAVAVVLLVSGLVRPLVLRRPAAGWMRLSHAMGWFNSRLLLTVLYALVITPMAIIGRLAGWDPMRRRRASLASMWTSYPARQHVTSHYDRMY